MTNSWSLKERNGLILDVTQSWRKLSFTSALIEKQRQMIYHYFAEEGSASCSSLCHKEVHQSSDSSSSVLVLSTQRGNKINMSNPVENLTTNSRHH